MSIYAAGAFQKIANVNCQLPTVLQLHPRLQEAQILVHHPLSLTRLGANPQRIIYQNMDFGEVKIQGEFIGIIKPQFMFMYVVS